MMMMTRKIRERIQAKMSVWPRGFGEPAVGFTCRYGTIVSIEAGVIKLTQGARVIMFRVRES